VFRVEIVDRWARGRLGRDLEGSDYYLILNNIPSGAWEELTIITVILSKVLDVPTENRTVSLPN
jgi:hypothetical protein